MTFIATVSHGKITLPPDANLPDGTQVRVEAIEREAPEELGMHELQQMLLRFAGSAKGLPADMADNHDHYLYGTPKRVN